MKAKEIKTVGRRRLVVRAEEGRVKIDILWKDKTLATLDIEPEDAAEFEHAVHHYRILAKKHK